MNFKRVLGWRCWHCDAVTVLNEKPDHCRNCQWQKHAFDDEPIQVFVPRAQRANRRTPT